MGGRSHTAIVTLRAHISRWPGLSVVLAFLVGALIGGAGRWEKCLDARGPSMVLSMLAVGQDTPHSASALAIPTLDFMEIGTSDFDTLMQTAAAGPRKGTVRGVSVDAMQIYLDHLPVLPHCLKVNAAVVGYRPHPAQIEVFFVDPADIKKHNLPGWLKGCNRLGRPHDTTAKVLEEAGLASLMQHRKVAVLSIDEILEKYGGCRIRTLKLDIEGLDPDLIVAYAGYLWQNPHCHADELLFEFNELSSESAQSRATEAIALVGYRHKKTTNFDAVWAYQPNADARRWMERTMQINERSTDGFFDEATLAAVLNEGASALKKDIAASNQHYTLSTSHLNDNAAVAASLKDKQEYCDRHDYDFHIIQETVQDRDAAWAKVPGILSLLFRYDWVFSLDADTVIYDHSIRLEEFLDPQHDMIIGLDGNGINSGVFFLRNSTWSKALLTEAWTITNEKMSRVWWEQAAIMRLMKNEGVRNHVKYCPQMHFNPYIVSKDDVHMSENGGRGPFIVHFAGLGDKWDLLPRFHAQRRNVIDQNGDN